MLTPLPENHWLTLVSPYGAIYLHAVRIGELPAIAPDHAWLSQPERARALRLKDKPQASFLRTRAWLRKMLAVQLACDPAEVPLGTDALGKPLLACGSLQVNWSHSRDACILAWSRTARLGVDIEFHRPRYSQDIAERYYHPDEFRSLQAVAPAQSAEIFYRLWSRKEAHYKCLGGAFMGGSLSLDLRAHQVGDALLWDFQGPFPREPHALGLCATPL